MLFIQPPMLYIPTAMRHLTIAVATTLLAFSLGACNEPESQRPGLNDKEDLGGYDVININPGESLTGLSVERLSVPVADATQAQLNRSLVVLSLHLPVGQSASIVMRAETQGLDSYLIVKDASDGENTGINDDQVVAAHLGRADAVVSVTAQNKKMDFIIFASGGVNLHTTGNFTIDAIVHDAPLVELHQSSVALQVYFDALRSEEPLIRDWVARGLLAEATTGLLEKRTDAISDIPLRERVELGRIVDSVNDDRLLLFDALIERSGSNGASQESVGNATGAIYQATRPQP